MKLHFANPKKIAGVLLIECLVYIAVFAVLFGGATTVFYFCWDHSAAIIAQTDQIHSALNVGERWRADVRAATGKISVETAPDGETVKIPAGENEIVYRFSSGKIFRQTGNYSALLLAKVKTSEMKPDARGGVTAWRWELELTPRRRETHLPLQFTFEAAQPNP